MAFWHLNRKPKPRPWGAPGPHENPEVSKRAKILENGGKVPLNIGVPVEFKQQYTIRWDDAGEQFDNGRKIDMIGDYHKIQLIGDYIGGDKNLEVPEQKIGERLELFEERVRKFQEDLKRSEQAQIKYRDLLEQKQKYEELMKQQMNKDYERKQFKWIDDLFEDSDIEDKTPDEYDEFFGRDHGSKRKFVLQYHYDEAFAAVDFAVLDDGTIRAVVTMTFPNPGIAQNFDEKAWRKIISRKLGPEPIYYIHARKDIEINGEASLTLEVDVTSADPDWETYSDRMLCPMFTYIVDYINEWGD